MTESYVSYGSGQSIRHGGRSIDIISPIDLQVTGTLMEADSAVVASLTEAAYRAFVANRKATLLERSHWLERAADMLEQEAQSVIKLIIEDVGKPRKAATFEVARSVIFLRSCATAVLHQHGETLPLDALKAGAGHFGYTRRVPYGVVAAITPFNAPSNLLIQKVGPALGAGNAVIVKPHLAGTRAALRIAEIFSASGLPDGLFNVLTGDRLPAAALVADARVMAVTFTGGTVAGQALARAAGAKKMLAELGSNAANVVLADANIETAAQKIAGAAFEASGQQCISAQRVLVANEVYEQFAEAFVRHASKLKVGSPYDDAVDLGPMVSLDAANRMSAMLDDARAKGARILLDGKRDNCYVSPSIVADAPRDAAVWTDEAFGPIAVLQRFSGVDEALALANDSPFGLQGAVFTNALDVAFRFADEFEVGSLWINEASRFRLDTYPFGGVKTSGYGREGIRYALEEMSQITFVGINLAA